MKPVCQMLMGLSATGLILLSACSKKVASADLEKSFEQAAPAESAAAAATPQDRGIKTAYKEAVEAVKQNDLPRAIEPLTVLRAQPNLTVDQRLAVEDIMGKVQTQLAERADRGDKAAQQALERYRQSRRR